MPTNLTETGTWTTPVTVPAAGDARQAASVNGAFQALANRSKTLRDAQANGQFGVGAPELACVDGANVAVAAFSVLIGNKLCSYAGGTYPPAGLAAATWYYLYAQDNGSGGVTVSHSLVAPDAARLWKSDETGVKRFLGSFRTLQATADVMGFVREPGGDVRILTPSFTDTFWSPQTAATAALTAWQTSNLKTNQDNAGNVKLVPPHARRVVVAQRVTTGNTADSWAEVRGDALAGAQNRVTIPHANGVGLDRATVDLTASQTILYRASDTNTTGAFLVVGYRDA